MSWSNSFKVSRSISKLNTIKITNRFHHSVGSPRICVVGAGPAGFYATQHILKSLPDARVDIIEKLPVPFGLVRFGVAPDHPEVKNVINTFTKTAENDRVNFIGNISLGKDVSLKTIRENYNAVVLCYGAAEDRHLAIPGEKENVLSAREFVAWYNGMPEENCVYSNIEANLRQSETVSIIGQGNVGVDVARILLSPIDLLRQTDITERSLNVLAESRVKRVHLIGRRGPLQVAFTIKELREMLKLSGVMTKWRKDDFNGINSELIQQLPRPKRRISELMLQSVNVQAKDDAKVFEPIFFRSPIEIKSIDSVKKELVLSVNRMAGDSAIATEEREQISTDLIFRSIGYKSVNACPADESLPFDESRGIIANEHGRVLSKNHTEKSKYERGLYVCGWLGTGPIGVILTTMNNSFSVAENLSNDWKQNLIDPTPKSGLEFRVDRQINWSQWQRIDAFEKQNGANVGKPREKLTDVSKMLEVAM